MKTISSRRYFFSHVSLTAGAIALGQKVAALEDNRPIVVGVMGLSRGRELANEFASKPNVVVKYLCDTDQDRLASAVQGWKLEKKPEGVRNWERILDDPQVDALVCAAPNHWHGPATILACAAGKHVYVEKPCSHNPQEGEWMIAAARKYNRCVQVGTQRRSSAATREAIERLHEGAIGRVYLARAYYNNRRGTLGHAQSSPAPEELDYSLWQGPAPAVPFRKNVVHYNWHWFWHWGGGELANNGVHLLDLCRWGLQVSYPTTAHSVGGRYAFEDDQETPDTQTATWEFIGRKHISWHGLSCNKHASPFIQFYGDGGTLELQGDGGYKIFDPLDKLVDEVKGTGAGQAEHVENFLEAVRANDSRILNCSIEEGHPSTLICHLGNIAQRIGRRLVCDPQNGRILNDPDGARLWEREYNEGWKERLLSAAGTS